MKKCHSVGFEDLLLLTLQNPRMAFRLLFDHPHERSIAFLTNGFFVAILLFFTIILTRFIGVFTLDEEATRQIQIIDNGLMRPFLRSVLLVSITSFALSLIGPLFKRNYSQYGGFIIYGWTNIVLFFSIIALGLIFPFVTILLGNLGIALFMLAFFIVVLGVQPYLLISGTLELYDLNPNIITIGSICLIVFLAILCVNGCAAAFGLNVEMKMN